jgi:probable rRNA maturation factor
MNNSSVERFVTKIRRAIPIQGLVNVLLTTSSEMKSLNARFRGKDEATDVLSFPANGMDGLAGEIAISLEIAKQNAQLLGHSAADEVKVLILHSGLHLAGYDHENDRGEMSREEQRLREALKLPVALIQRNKENLTVRGKPPKIKASGTARRKR